MKENYYGFNFKTIPKEVIKYKGTLENMDVIQNDSGRELIWCSHDNGYKLITNDAYDYLEKEEIRKSWKKV